MLRFITVISALAFLSACASYGVVENAALQATDGDPEYSLHYWDKENPPGEDFIILSLSGGGTRAAALAYGVLEELRDTQVVVDGQSKRMLDGVDRITSVSGGSFAAAYYGLYGDEMFDRFEDEFLRNDIQSALEWRILNPINWLKKGGRTELAVGLYDKELFHGATYRDMIKPDQPLVVINASDLGHGVRFSFIQEYFDVLCSDLTSFPVARAVTASSAVPIVFPPVVLENHAECGSELPDWLTAIEGRAQDEESLELALLSKNLAGYYDRDRRKFVHLVDGGITDNLGLRADYDIVELTGGAKAYIEKYEIKPPRRYVIISVDASTDPQPDMDASRKSPSLGETIGAMSDVQLHRYNASTIDLLNRQSQHWAESLSTPEAPVSAYFVYVTFQSLPDEDRAYFSTVPTSFRLTDEQVDRLTEAGRKLLRGNPDYQRLIADISGE